MVREFMSAASSLRSFALLLVCGSIACPAEPVDVVQGTGSSTGYYRVVFDLAAEGLEPAEVESMLVGGVAAIDLRPTAEGLDVLLQGAPEPGPADVVVMISGVPVLLEQKFEYLPPLDPRFERMVAFGASLGQGVQDGVPTFDGSLNSPSLALARLLGAYLPSPIPERGLIETLVLEDIGPAPGCRSPSVVDHITTALTDTLPRLAREDGSGFGYDLARVDPRLETRNISAGNYHLEDVLYGPTVDEFAQVFLSHLSYDPFGDFGAVPTETMLEVLEGLEPTLIFSTDLLGNDALGRVDPAIIEQDLPELFERLAATGAEAFIGEVPDIRVLPGRFGNDDPGLLALTEAYNALLYREADRHDNVHIVPLFDRTRELADEGMVVDGQELSIHMLGGLLSYDGLHFSNTGYAMVAQEFADRIAEQLDVDLPPVDLRSIVAADPHAPAAIRAAGREPDDCVPR